ncbi:MAG: hypothetical protein E6917_03800 [Clostridium botulinum]|nr:hypothetical protein [Clostridium botulinum]
MYYIKNIKIVYFKLVFINFSTLSKLVSILPPVCVHLMAAQAQAKERDSSLLCFSIK